MSITLRFLYRYISFVTVFFVNKQDGSIRPPTLTASQSNYASCHFQIFFQKKFKYSPGDPGQSGRIQYNSNLSQCCKQIKAELRYQGGFVYFLYFIQKCLHTGIYQGGFVYIVFIQVSIHLYRYVLLLYLTQPIMLQV